MVGGFIGDDVIQGAFGLIVALELLICRCQLNCRVRYECGMFRVRPLNEGYISFKSMMMFSQSPLVLKVVV